MDPVLTEAVRAQQEGTPAAMATVVQVAGHAPQVVGARMVVYPDGRIVGTIGGGRVEQVVIEQAQEIIGRGLPELLSYKLKAELGMCCGGQMDIFVEPLALRPRLILFGAGHVARPTAALAATCGFDIVVVDERPDWNTEERFPAAHRHVVPHEDFLAEFGFRTSDYVVIATPNHEHDREVLAGTAGCEAGYVGMIGSRRKVERTLLQLRTQGLADEHLARVYAPVGLDILAETPEEIAVSIVGELIRHRRAPLSRKKTRGATVEAMRDAAGEDE